MVGLIIACACEIGSGEKTQGTQGTQGHVARDPLVRQRYLFGYNAAAINFFDVSKSRTKQINKK